MFQYLHRLLKFFSKSNEVHTRSSKFHQSPSNVHLQIIQCQSYFVLIICPVRASSVERVPTSQSSILQSHCTQHRPLATPRFCLDCNPIGSGWSVGNSPGTSWLSKSPGICCTGSGTAVLAWHTAERTHSTGRQRWTNTHISLGRGRLRASELVTSD